MNELKPCPFCGGQFLRDHPAMANQMSFTSAPKVEELTAGGWRVSCYGCGVKTWDNLNYTREQAITAWNTRVGMRAELDRIAGPLVKTLELFHQDCDTNGHCWPENRCAACLALANYRKERGV